MPIFFRCMLVLILVISKPIWAEELKTFTAHKVDSLSYRLRKGKCAKKCKVEIALFNNTKQINSIILPVEMVPEIKSVSKKQATGVLIWESGAEETATELTIKTIQLDAEKMGLLVTMEVGFEHVHRFHRLYAIDSGKIAELWKGDENFAGPESSVVEVFKLKDLPLLEGFYRIYSFGYLDAETNVAERWEIDFYKLSKSGKVEASATNNPNVYGAIIGSFPTVKEAEVFLSGLKTEKSCGSTFLILASSKFIKLKPGLVIIAQPELTELAAQEALKKASECNPKIKGYVKVFQ